MSIHCTRAIVAHVTLTKLPLIIAASYIIAPLELSTFFGMMYITPPDIDGMRILG